MRDQFPGPASSLDVRNLEPTPMNLSVRPLWEVDRLDGKKTRVKPALPRAGELRVKSDVFAARMEHEWVRPGNPEQGAGTGSDGSR